MSDPDDNLKGNAVPEVVAEAKAKVIQPIHGAHAGSDGPAAVMNDESGGTREKTGEPADSFASAGKPSLAETHANDGSSALRGNRHETPDRIEAEMKRLGEERASLGMEAWAGQSEALKNAAAAAREYRIAIADLGTALDAASGRFDLYAKGLNKLSAAHRRFIRSEHELAAELMNSSGVGAPPSLAPAAGERGDEPPSPPVPRPSSHFVAKPVDPSTLAGPSLFSQAETIVAIGSATPQQQQFLANLASIMSAHSLTYQQAIEYFKINEGNLQIVTNILEHHKTAIANFAARLDALGH